MNRLVRSEPYDDNAPSSLERTFARYARTGEGAALASVIETVSPELRRIARYYVRNEHATEDLVQATILTAIERAEVFDSSRRLLPWLTGILLNKIAAHRRESRRRFVDITEDAMPEVVPFDGAESSEVARLVVEAMEQLPRRYREVLELYLREGMRGGEIASELDRPPGTIRAQIHRGLRRLRSLLPPSLALSALLALRRRADAQGADGATIAPTGRAGATTPTGLAASSAGMIAVGVALVAAVSLWVATLDGSAREVRASQPEARVDEAFDGTVARGDTADHVVNGATGSADETLASRALAAATDARTAPAAIRDDVVVFEAYDRASDERLAGVSLSIRIETADGARTDALRTTDALGRCSVDVDPHDVVHVTVSSEREGYARLDARWDRSEIVFERGKPLVVPLIVTRPIGGRVVDELGAPVEGASVHLALAMLANGRRWEVSNAAAADRIVATTDADGRWRIDEASSGPAQMNVRVSHPDFAPSLGFGSRDALPIEALWALDATTVLREGQPFELTVRDEDGRPVPGAVVSLVEARDPPPDFTEYPIDASGVLRFVRPHGRFLLRVRAPGFQRQIELIRPGKRSMDVVMPRAVLLAARVVDARGVAVGDAQLRRYGDTWSEAIAADADGRFELFVNPKGNVMLQVRRSGVMGWVHASLDLKTGVLELPPRAELRITALDATTGAPLEDYEVHLRAADGGNLGSRAVSRVASDVDWTPVVFHGREGAVIATVEKVGYAPASTRPVFVGDEPLVLEVRATPVPMLDVSVLAPDGARVPFLEAAIATESDPVTVSNGSLFTGGPTKIHATGADGVRFNRPDGNFHLAITCRDGFAFVSSATLDANPVVTVTPWACVEGNSSSPTIALRSTSPGLTLAYAKAPAADGSYHFCTVPPGALEIVGEGGEPLRAFAPGGGVARVDW